MVKSHLIARKSWSKYVGHGEHVNYHCILLRAPIKTYTNQEQTHFTQPHSSNAGFLDITKITRVYITKVEFNADSSTSLYHKGVLAVTVKIKSSRPPFFVPESAGDIL